MARVKTDFQRLPVSEKILRSSAITDAMDGNAYFPTPTPTLQEIRALIQLLEDAYQDAYYGGRMQTSVMNVCARNLATAITGLSGYVQAASGGDEAIILSSGFETRDSATASKPVLPPGAPVMKPGRRDGELLLNWTPVSGARSYTVQVSHDNGETWELAGTFTKSRVVIPALPSATRPWFRVSAFGILGESNWSEIGIGKVA